MNKKTTSFRKAMSDIETFVTAHWPGLVENFWFWRKVFQWLMLSALPLVLVVSLQIPLFNFWQWILSVWSRLLGLTHLIVIKQEMMMSTFDDGSFAPSNTVLFVTLGAVVLIWLGTGRLSDHLHPLKVTLRALCIIQLTACLYFAFSPASFPYNLSAHLQALMNMGYGFMLAIPPMLALGLGILKVAWPQKMLAPLGILAYFAVMLPHKLVLHAWLIEHGSVLFIPLLFFAFGSLLDLLIFIALYAWLASMTPADITYPRSAHT